MSDFLLFQSNSVKSLGFDSLIRCSQCPQYSQFSIVASVPKSLHFFKVTSIHQIHQCPQSSQCFQFPSCPQSSQWPSCFPVFLVYEKQMRTSKEFLSCSLKFLSSCQYDVSMMSEHQLVHRGHHGGLEKLALATPPHRKQWPCRRSSLSVVNILIYLDTPDCGFR